MSVKTTVFPAGTDSVYMRAIGVPALGFSPINGTPELLHDHNEYLNIDIFLEGIALYQKIIEKISNVAGYVRIKEKRLKL